MDGLSVASSIIGLIAAAGQMTVVLYNVGTAVKDASHLARAVVSELGDITSTLSQLQNYLEGRARASAQRLSLISVEHITATLTGCVMTYSELDVLLKSLHADSGMRMFDRAKWVLKKDQVDALVVRLQNHKISLSLMLNIMQCASQTQAEASMDSLCDKVNEVLRTNQQLSMRLRNIEDAFTRGTSTPRPGSDGLNTPRSTTSSGRSTPRQDLSPDFNSSAEPPSSDPDNGSLRRPSAPTDNQPRISAFEELLSRSRVYRNRAGSHSESSLVDDGRSTLAASIRSSLTLDDVSNISVYAIPIYAVDLSNSECYTFGGTGSERFQSQTSQPSTASSIDQEQIESISSRRAWWRRLGKSPSQQKITPTPTPSPKIFGTPLQTSIRYANIAVSLFDEEGNPHIYGYIPIIVGKCGVHLKQEGTFAELIFEKAGTPKHIQELQLAFDSPPKYGKGLDWTPYTVFDCGSVLVRYLLSLPEPLVPYELYAAFTDPLRGHQASAVGRVAGQYPVTDDSAFEEEAVAKHYTDLIIQLPPLNRQLLQYMLDLMAVFASKSDVNLMTTQRLVAAFYQGILVHPDYKYDARELRLAQDVLIFLVENQDSFLDGMAVTPSE